MEVPMRKLLGRLRAGGILEMLGSTWQRGGGRPRGADGGPSALTVHHVLPAFLVLAAGLLAASGVFVAELLLAHRTRAAALHHRGTVVDTPRTRY
ncbi:hypothetical protein ONE63_005411 [Megalurothrips usitatus]|uniref:Uncharacterized protein n=1 Tax=Megalurothrips usitatus TaxID=439358 RepID=A0AAV7Y2M7_9NEOP|nr:hypothetical protein ONE63_005411 [Megalurothrips usitatus]